MNTKALTKIFANAGFKVELDAGPAGVVIYGASEGETLEAAREFRKILASRSVKAEFVKYGFDADEPSETAFATLVTFDWAGLPV